MKVVPRSEYHYSDHCSVNVPFYCLFHSQGSTMHTHIDFYEFCFVISGSYTNTYQGEVTSCQTGHVLFFNIGETHSFLDTTESSNHYAFTIKKEYFEEFCRKYLENAEEILSTPSASVKLSGPLFAYLSHLASSIARSYSPDRQIIGRQLLEVLLYNCFDTTSGAVEDSIVSYTHDLKQRFDNYQLLNISITDICNEYPISQCSLISAFKELTGHTLVQYRAMKRMEYAAHLLAEESYPITMIAEILNISSPTYFSQQFKQTYGVSPKQYQLQHRSHKYTRDKGGFL